MNDILCNSTTYKDNSKKETIDVKIKLLLDLINSLEDYALCYFVFLSCRVTLFRSSNYKDTYDKARTRTNKENSTWYLLSYDNLTLEEFQSLLLHSRLILLCQFELFMLHVTYSSLSLSKSLLQIILQNGLRDSGLLVTNKCITQCA